MVKRAVAEGNAPDIAVLDHVWAPEFAGAGFLHPFEDLDPRWVRREHDVDFLASLVAADRYEGADVRGAGVRRGRRFVVRQAEVA